MTSSTISTEYHITIPSGPKTMFSAGGLTKVPVPFAALEHTILYCTQLCHARDLVCRRSEISKGDVS